MRLQSAVRAARTQLETLKQAERQATEKCNSATLRRREVETKNHGGMSRASISLRNLSSQHRWHASELAAEAERQAIVLQKAESELARWLITVL